MINTKKKIYFIISIFIVVILLGVSYAFFNYIRTGNSNTIKVGRISFTTNQSSTINLNNLFAIDPTENGIMDDETKVGTLVIDIEGDTDYSDGIEYLVSSVDSEIYTSTGQVVPISLDFTISNGLGTSDDNYFVSRDNTNASIYKKLVGDTLVGDEMLLVGYIVPNTTSGTPSGIDGSITIKAYLDKNKILISDTYDGSESDNMGTTNSIAEGKSVFTTNEWNTLQNTSVSFKIKVEANEGIWVVGSLEEIMRKSAVMDNIASTYVSASTGIDFGIVSSDTNGKGVYIRSGTENDTYPIMYYRGDIDNNNVLFANYCWKAVRTTDTGGVKLIYDGEADIIKHYDNNEIMSDTDITYTNDETYPFTYDINTKKWTSGNASINSSDSSIKFKVKEAGIYSINYDVSSEKEYDEMHIYINDVLKKTSSGIINSTYNLEYLSTNDEILMRYRKDSSNNKGEDRLTFELVKNSGNNITSKSCSNVGFKVLIIDNSIKFQYIKNYYNSPAYVGYMYGKVYTSNTANWTSGARFGSSFTWDGTKYTLVDDVVTTPNATHHYSCNVTTQNGTCTELRFVYDSYGNNKAYIILTNGETLDDALKQMQENTTNSNVKTVIDTWYANKMRNYTNKIEDTIYCNDRSIIKYNSWDASTAFNDSTLEYGPYARSNFGDNSNIKNKPSLECTNKNDRFTVNNANGNRSLTYPTALLTSDEYVLAGAASGSSGKFYLYDSPNSMAWTMSPAFFDVDTSFVMSYVYDFNANIRNYSITLDTVDDNYAIRPVISLKPNQNIIKGEGTNINPYIIE